jgi:hypothetical protein
MKPAHTTPLPVVRVTRGTKTAPQESQAPLDLHTMGLFVKVAGHLGTLRSRLNGAEARLRHLEELLERKGRQ